MAKETHETKLQLRLADMLRKTVGVSHLEREQFQLKLAVKKDKARALKLKLRAEMEERERVSERNAFLELQFSKHTNVMLSGYVKSDDVENNTHPLIDPKEVTKKYLDAKHLNQEYERENMQLKQQVHELTISLKYYNEERDSKQHGKAMMNQ
jgi:hypothetical protein